MKLYEIKDKFIEAFNAISVDDTTGEVTGIEELDKISGQFDEKAVETALWIIELRGDIEQIKNEEKRLSDRRKQLERQVSSVSNYLIYCAGEAGISKVESDPRVKIRFGKSESVEIDPIVPLPDEYYRVTTKREPNKAAIKKAIKAGDTVPGAYLIENRTISIK